MVSLALTSRIYVHVTDTVAFLTSGISVRL